MLDSVYKNAAAMTGLENWNNAVAQNLAQTSTPGYKKDLVTFESVANGMVGFQDAFKNTQFHETTAAFANGHVDFSAGPIANTGNATDFAIDGEGFFELRKPDGDFVYTRDGQFHISEKGMLVSKQGYQVMTEGRAAIQLIPEEGPIVGSPDGTIKQGIQEIGKLGIRKIEKTENLSRTSGGFVLPPDKKDDAKVHQDAVLRPGALEGSNVTATNEMVSLINLSRSFQLNQRVIQNHDETLGRAIRQLGGHA